MMSFDSDLYQESHHSDNSHLNQDYSAQLRKSSYVIFSTSQ